MQIKNSLVISHYSVIDAEPDILGRPRRLFSFECSQPNCGYKNVRHFYSEVQLNGILALINHHMVEHIGETRRNKKK